MPKANVITTNFTTGEVSPLMKGRVDTTRYANGADTISNFTVKAQGGLWRRPGTQFITRCHNGLVWHPIVKEFEFSNIQAYLLEFSDQVIFIRYNDGANIFTSHPITGASDNGSSGIRLTVPTTGLSTGQYVDVRGVAGTYEANGMWQITVIDATHMDLQSSVFTHAYVASSGTSTRVMSVVSPYRADGPNQDVLQLSFTQSADVMFIFHPLYQPRKLNRFSSSSWTLPTYDAYDGPYLGFNDNLNYEMAVTGYTDSATYFRVSGTAIGLVGGDVNKYVEWKDSGVWMLGKITAVTSTDVATIDVVDNVMLGLDSEVVLKARLDNTTIAQVPGRIHPVQNIKDNGGGSLVSGFAQTFSPSDVGKYVRRTTDGVWCLITAYTDDKTVTFTAATMKASGYPATITAVRDRTTSGTLTAVRRLGTSAVVMFASTDVGRHVRLNYSGQQCWGIITAYTSASAVTVSFQTPVPFDVQNPAALSNDGLATSFKLGAWGETTGWPSLGVFHEQRLVLARTSTEPQSFWMSVSGDFANHSPTEPDSTVLDDSAINYALASSKVNAITWLNSGPVLLIGTIGGEWQVKSASTVNEPITPANINASVQTTYGSVDYSNAVKVGHALLMIQRSGKRMIELTYDFAQDSWVGRDITIIGEHIFRQGGGAKFLVSQADSNNFVWALLNDGTLACCTYVKDQEVIAWHRHSVGGTIRSLCTIVSSTNEQVLFMVVDRAYSGQIRVIEKLAEDNYPSSSTDRNGMYHVDCGIVHNFGVATAATWKDFFNLIGATIQVLKNGVYLGTFLVADDGSVNIGQTVTGYMVGGLAITSTFRSLSPEGGSPFGTSQGKAKRVDKLDVRLYNSVSFKFGSDLAALSEETCTDDGSIFTGDKRVNLEQAYGTDGSYYLVQDKPYPLIVLAVMPHLSTQE